MTKDGVESWLFRQKHDRLDREMIVNIAARARVALDSLFYVHDKRDLDTPLEIFSFAHMEPAKIEYNDAGKPKRITFVYRGETWHIKVAEKDKRNKPRLHRLLEEIQSRYVPVRSEGELRINTDDGQRELAWAREILKRKDSARFFIPSPPSWSPLRYATNMWSFRERDEFNGTNEEETVNAAQPETVRRRSSVAVLLNNLTLGRHSRNQSRAD